MFIHDTRNKVTKKITIQKRSGKLWLTLVISRYLRIRMIYVVISWLYKTVFPEIYIFRHKGQGPQKVKYKQCIIYVTLLVTLFSHLITSTITAKLADRKWVSLGFVTPEYRQHSDRCYNQRMINDKFVTDIYHNNKILNVYSNDLALGTWIWSFSQYIIK